MTGRVIEVLPAARVIEIVEATQTRAVEVPGRSIEIVEVGRLTVNTTGGASAFVHTQGAAASTWIINHPLGRLPSVTIYLASGEEVESDVTSTATTTTITFPTPFAGTAILN